MRASSVIASVLMLLITIDEARPIIEEPCDNDTDCYQVGDEGCIACDMTLGICVTPNEGQQCCMNLGPTAPRVYGTCNNGFCVNYLLHRGSRMLQPCLCPPGSSLCNDPHMQGLRGQHIDVVGVDGGWYCLVKDNEVNLHVNVRFTAPLPDKFPHRQLITGLAVISNEHSIVIDVRHPYEVIVDGCPSGHHSPCLADGGLRISVDGEDADDLLRPTKDKYVVGEFVLSSTNLPVECRQFGGDKLWAAMYAEMMQGKRRLAAETFEEWVLKFKDMAAHDWCTKYISERGLAHVESNHAVFRIETPAVVLRLNAGVNHQGSGEEDWDGTVLPELDFWQMDVGIEGLDLESSQLTGLLGETARPVLDNNGEEVMKGSSAIRGSVEDYRVTDALGKDFALLSKGHGQIS